MCEKKFLSPCIEPEEERTIVICRPCSKSLFPATVIIYDGKVFMRKVSFSLPKEIT
jgi:hypothetical protein